MRFSSYAPLALAANLAAAMPRPQEIDFDISITINTDALIASATAAISSVAVDVTDVLSATAIVQAKRAAATCVTQAPGATSVPDFSGDTAAQFLAENYFSSVASANAAAPSGYTQAFVNKQAANNAFGYLGFVTMDTYNVKQCATQCDNKYGCSSFNVYFERDPSIDPTGTLCSNPLAVTMIKCVRGGFSVAVAGNNGYVTNKISTPDGFQTGVPFGKFAMNAPYDAQGYNTYMGAKMFTGNWDVTQCSEYCKAQTTYNKNTAPKDGTPLRRPMVQSSPRASTAHSTPRPGLGSWQGKDQYTIDYSFGFTMTDAGIDPTVGDSTGAKYQAVADIKWSSLQPFCSAYLGYITPLSTMTATATSTPVVTSTAYSTTTVLPKRKRDGSNSPYPGLSTDSSIGGVALIDANGTRWYSSEIPSGGPLGSIHSNSTLSKRSVSIPAGLAKYQPAVISAACAMQATPVTSTSLQTSFTTVTGAATTTVVSVVSTVTSIPSYTPYLENLYFASGGASAIADQDENGYVYAGIRNNKYFSDLAVKAGFFVDSTTGHFKDVQGRTAVAYDNAGQPASPYVIFFNSEQMAQVDNYLPLICTYPTTLPSKISCSATMSNGDVYSHFVAVQDSYYQLAALCIADRPASQLHGDQYIAWSDAALTLS
ncbi:hypothetical protein AUEXF2481DRAFT_93119 [Aureobasidium subglaciale EXF-2481]|uniref:Apple domain-containing protein n=1 Tax=Aureobasidium subglaciale (strain EXF-2481) TaxID=1043005 RepID=A0A074XXN4_AURSE|nr:uncharacterized protein AUEXF2481DRAFT_93119 [Aureobasidium subglaciale EXF-2481]KEQ90230.1 hypothetical protein AUEXF2481DRAFT_93119 [Aureobasidium subglaciale EXF-2481]